VPTINNTHQQRAQVRLLRGNRVRRAGGQRKGRRGGSGSSSSSRPSRGWCASSGSRLPLLAGAAGAFVGQPAVPAPPLFAPGLRALVRCDLQQQLRQGEQK